MVRSFSLRILCVLGVSAVNPDREKLTGRKEETFLSHQKPQNMRPVISKVTDNNQRARQNDCRISADKADLQVTNRLSKINYGATQVMNQAVNHSDIEKLPQAFARTHQNWIDNRGVVNFVDVILIFQKARHLPQRLALKHKPADANSK